MNMTTNNLSAAFCRFLAKRCIFLFFSVLASKSLSLLITPIRDFKNLFKRTSIQMSLYGHLKSFQPQNPHRKKQTFSNRGVLSLCAADSGKTAFADG
jgi:hypothetical protein